MKLQAYPRYKPSGVEWLGEIPEHWEVIQIKALARPGYKTFTDGDWIEAPFIRDEGIRLVQTGNIGIGVYREQGFRYIDDETFRQFRCTEVLPVDVLICRLADPVGRACLAPELGARMITSVDVCILKPRDDVDPRFIVYALSCQAYISWMSFICRGGTRDRISRSMLGSIRIQSPPVEEHRAIAEFLDHETARIDALIDKKERQIELLREKRAALISQAVTKGLDANVKMKDSGVEWMGDIPEHWTVTVFKRLGNFQAGAGFSDSDQGITDEELPFYKVSDTNLKGNEVSMVVHNNSVSRDTAARLRAYVLPTGTIVFAKVGAALLLNKRRILSRQSCIDNNMMGFIPKNCAVKWAYYWMCVLDLAGLANPGAVPSINEEQVRCIRVPVPPINDQRAISNYLDSMTGRIDALIVKVLNSVELLGEYRSALISAAVTGKIDVRNKETAR